LNWKKLLLAGLVGLLALSFFALGLQQYLTLEYLQGGLDRFREVYRQQPFPVLGLFFLLYLAVTAVSLPGAAILTLAAGALFGLLAGTILVSFASTLGATLAFLIVRYLFRDTVERRFGTRLQRINEGIRKDGAYYLFTLRLVPLFPFFLINMLMALTPVRTWTFFWVSQLGMLPGTLVYVNAGTQLARVTSPEDLLTPSLVAAFVLLGLFPWLARIAVARLQALRVYGPWRKVRPKKFDRNLIVIGAGSAGLVTAYIAALLKASVTLVEKHKMGGDCLNTGCVPSKTLIRSAAVRHACSQAAKFGIQVPEGIGVDFRSVMDRVHDVIRRIEPHDSVERYTNLGVDCRKGQARLVSPWEVEIRNGDNVERLTTRSIVIASGGEPFVPPIPGLDHAGYLTSDSLWEIRELPGRLVVLGGGPIGCELAQAFARLGSRVTLVEMLPRLLPREDPDASDLIRELLQADGVELLLAHKAARVAATENGKTLHAEHEDGVRKIDCDEVLVAVGRRARTAGVGLEELGIETTPAGNLQLNEYLQTKYPNIYACGDVAGPYQFTHTAGHQAWYAAINALFGRFWRFRADYSVIPWATFTDPEVARVGVNETEAREQGIDHEVTRYDLADLDRAMADGSDYGFVKVLTARNSDRILGATVVARHAAELIMEYVLAMRHGIGLNKILGTIHIYPTLAEANRFAAGEWKRKRAPESLLNIVGRCLAWQRG
jgi:dihydrolipoamide dehydrogenase